MFPLIEEAGFGSKPVDKNTFEDAAEVMPIGAGELEEGIKVKGKKRRGTAPPKGQSCAARILSLKDEDFFKGHRSVADIVEGLKNKGWTHKSNQVGASLTQMFGRGDIQRTKEGNGAWKYYWDRS